MKKYREKFPHFCPDEYKAGHQRGYQEGHQDACNAGYQEDYPMNRLEAYLTESSLSSMCLGTPPAGYRCEIPSDIRGESLEAQRLNRPTHLLTGYTEGYNDGYLEGYKEKNQMQSTVIEIEHISQKPSVLQENYSKLPVFNSSPNAVSDCLQSNPDLQIDTQPNSPINSQTNSRVKKRMIAMISGNDPDQDKEFKSLTIRLSIQDYAHLSVLASRLNQSTSGLAKEIFVGGLLDSIDTLKTNGGDKALNYYEDVETEKLRISKKTG